MFKVSMLTSGAIENSILSIRYLSSYGKVFSALAAAHTDNIKLASALSAVVAGWHAMDTNALRKTDQVGIAFSKS